LDNELAVAVGSATPIIIIESDDQPAIADLLIGLVKIKALGIKSILKYNSGMKTPTYAHPKNKKVGTEIKSLSTTLFPSIVDIFISETRRGAPDSTDNQDEDSAATKAHARHILVLENIHNYWNQNSAITQSILNVRDVFSVAGLHILIVVPPGAHVPLELKSSVKFIDHKLPGDDEILEIITDTLGDRVKADQEPAKTQLKEVAAGMKGLTRYQIRATAAEMFTRHRKPDLRYVIEARAGLIKKIPGLTVYDVDNDTNFSNVGGMAGVKKFIKDSLTGNSTNPSVHPKGIVLLGVPGVGKTYLMRAVSQEIGRIPVVLDIPALFARYVGETETNVRKALSTVEAMGKVLLCVDEINLAVGFGGADDSHEVTSRLVSTLLTWINDQKDAYIIATANSLDGLPDAFTRPGRFDSIFFVDVPSRKQLREIWTICKKKYNIAPGEEIPDVDKWTGAEVDTCCRLSALNRRPLIETYKNVIPWAKSYEKQFKEMRSKASEKFLDANKIDHIFTTDETDSYSELGLFSQPGSAISEFSSDE
jgi:hypothetical protein